MKHTNLTEAAKNGQIGDTVTWFDGWMYRTGTIEYAQAGRFFREIIVHADNSYELHDSMGGSGAHIQIGGTLDSAVARYHLADTK